MIKFTVRFDLQPIEVEIEANSSEQAEENIRSNFKEIIKKFEPAIYHVVVTEKPWTKFLVNLMVKESEGFRPESFETKSQLDADDVKGFIEEEIKKFVSGKEFNDINVIVIN